MAQADGEVWDWAAMRQRSRALFNSPHRLAAAVLAASSETDDLYAGRIADRTGMTRAEAKRQLASFEDADLIESAGRAKPRGRTGQPPLVWRRCDDRFWALVLDLGEKYRR